MTDNYITTFSGKKFDPLNPDPNLITIADIAHGLSNTCRFNGQCRGFYSVAQHSLLVASLLPPKLKLQGLMHDATEAYIGDVTSPVKRRLRDYKEIEQNLWRAIALRFDLPEHLHDWVKHADLIALATEKRELVNGNDHWEMLDGIEPISEDGDLDLLGFHYPVHIRSRFLNLFDELAINRR